MTTATLDPVVLTPTPAHESTARFDWETFAEVLGPERARAIRLAAFQVAGQLARGRWPVVVRPSAIMLALAAGVDVALVRAVAREAARAQQDPGVALVALARSTPLPLPLAGA